MTTISDTLYDPSGAPVPGVVVRAALVAASELITAGGAIVREAETLTAADGTWSLTLTPVSHLAEPGGAYYLVTADGHRWTIDVPDSGTFKLGAVAVVAAPLPPFALTPSTGVALAAYVAEGDILVGTGPGTVARLAVGADGHVLTADSGSADGVSWSLASGNAANGIPDGGATGQLLRKTSDVDFAATWHTTTAADVGADATGTAAGLVNALTAADVGADPAGTAATDVAALAATLGGAATLNVGTTTGTVSAGNDSRIVGAMQLNPPNVAGAYVGQTAVAPDPSQGSTGNPWLAMRQPYSGADNNPDSIQLFATHSDGTTKIKTGWRNGNNEGRDAPSTATRIARRIFDFAVSLGGPSTSRFFELSSNPTLASDREPLLGAYGLGSTTKPGWIEATRILSGIQGVAVGGGYPTGALLSQFIVRGRKATAGAPTTGTYLASDVVLALDGFYLCTVGGTPGTWVALGSAGSAPSAFVDVTPATNVAHAAKHMATRLEVGGAATRLRGEFAVSGALTASTLGTIPTVAHRPLTTVTVPVRGTSGGATLTISTAGVMTINPSPTSGSVWFDSLTYDLV